MIRLTFLLRPLLQLACTRLTRLVKALHYLRLCLRPVSALTVENLFLRKQLVLYWERNMQLKRAANATCNALLWLAR
jgi:hypothetical protein